MTTGSLTAAFATSLSEPSCCRQRARARVETIVNPILSLKVLSASLSFTRNQRWRCHTVTSIAPFTRKQRQTNAQENRSDDKPSRSNHTQNSRYAACQKLGS
jgi:hypothetical protein